MFVRSSAGGWQSAGSSVNGTSGRNTYTATAGQTTFSATYDVGYVDVFLNGVKLLVGTDVVATSGSTVVLSVGATAGDIIDIVGYGTFQLADHYSKTASDARFLGLAGGTMTGDIDGNGNKVLFGNVYSQLSDLPSASTYHGMFAHVHATGKGYFAHAGNWIPLANDTEKLNLSGGTMTGNLDVGGSVEFDSLSGTGAVSITDILDEDNMASNSATALATQQSIKAYTDTAVANLVDSSPASLDTLNELAAALGDDASFSTTITNSIATKLPLAGGTLTGNLDVGGTVTSDGLTVDGSGYVYINTNGAGANPSGDKGLFLSWNKSNSIGESTIGFNNQTGLAPYLQFASWDGTNFLRHMRIDDTGDISFYNSAGSAAKFFWDASTERLGLGTSSPQRPLHMNIGTDNTAARFQSTDTEVSLEFIDTAGTAYFRASGDYIKMGANQTDSLTILDGGNVGIGTSSITSFSNIPNLTVGGSSGGMLTNQVNGTDGMRLYSNSSGTVLNETRNLFLQFATNNTERMRIDSSGRVGIGTSSPSKKFVVSEGGAHGFEISPYDGSQNATRLLNYNRSTNAYFPLEIEASQIAFEIDGSESMRIDSSGKVGIGTSSPNATLTVSQSSNNIFAVERTGVSSGSGQFGINIETNSQATVSYDDGAQLVFGTASSPSTHAGFTERMRIDASGNVLVGTTDNNVTNNSGNNPGINIGVAGIKGFISSARYQGPPLSINRLGNDGDIQLFSKDGTTVGSIGTANSGDLYIGNDDTTLLFAGGSDAIIPRGTAGATRDAAIDLGLSAHRFKNGYFSGSLYGDGSNLTGVGGSTTAGAVGTYALIGDASGGSHYSHGATISGSLLDRAYSVYNFEYATITARSGTWRCMGYSGISVYGTLWLRIS